MAPVLIMHKYDLSMISIDACRIQRRRHIQLVTNDNSFEPLMFSEAYQGFNHWNDIRNKLIDLQNGETAKEQKKEP